MDQQTIDTTKVLMVQLNAISGTVVLHQTKNTSMFLYKLGKETFLIARRIKILSDKYTKNVRNSTTVIIKGATILPKKRIGFLR